MSLSVLIIDDERAIHINLDKFLKRLSCSNIKTSLTASGAIKVLQDESFDLVLLDINIGCENGMEYVKLIKQKQPHAEIYMISAVGTIRKAVMAMKLGASGFLEKPIEFDELSRAVSIVKKNKALRHENVQLKEKVAALEGQSAFMGECLQVKEVFKTIEKLKNKECDVLITGESGTGKELIAQAIHRQEKNLSRPFIITNVNACPASLIESEFFGHVKGAFTGATASRRGKFELAHGGDIFLDEIGSLSLDLQKKFLRVLQEREVSKVGSETTRKFKFRVISATKEDLKKMVDEKQFREDLYYRLKVIHIHLPPLRERGDDLMLLAKYFLHKKDSNKKFTNEAIKIIKSYNWPGNVRELKHEIEMAATLVDGDVIDVSDLTIGRTITQVKATKEGKLYDVFEHIQPLNKAIKTFEKKYIEHILKRNYWKKTQSAKDLGIQRSFLYRKLNELNIDK